MVKKENTVTKIAQALQMEYADGTGDISGGFRREPDWDQLGEDEHEFWLNKAHQLLDTIVEDIANHLKETS